MMLPGVLNKLRHEIRYWLLRRLPTCEQIVPLLSESLERRLGLRERFLASAHLLTCIWCVWYRDQLRTLRTEAPSSSDAATQTGAHRLSTAARDRIRRRLGDARG